MSKIKLLYLGLLLLGVGLICAVFIILLKPFLNEQIFYLNLAVSLVVYSVLMFSSGILFSSADHIDSQSGGMGIKWFFVGMYALLAVSAMVAMFYYLAWSFEIQILVQIGLLLILLYGMVSSQAGIDKTKEVDQQHKTDAAGLTTMRELVSIFEIRISGKNPDNSLVQALHQIKDNLRYLSPSINPMAIEIEQQFISSMHSIIDSVSGDPNLPWELTSRLDSCNILLKQRKNFNYN